MARIGRTDPIRIPGGKPSTNIAAEVSSLRSQAPAQGPFSRAIVFEVLGDISRRTDEELTALAASVSGGIDALRRAPRNSLIVKAVAGKGSSIPTDSTLCYPFFPPHFGMPIKPGEQVWVMKENSDSVSPYSYWITRVAEPNFVDDINYTHAERRFDLYVDKVTSESASSIEGDSAGEEVNPFDGLKDEGKTPGPPAFNNTPEGDDRADATLSSNTPEEADINPYDQIYTGSFAMQSFKMEPVPRFTKRPGDLVIQGSNNTLICLGQDRGWNLENRPDGAEHSNAYVDVDTSGAAVEPIPDFCGTIDIVSGRGRFYPQTPPDPDNSQIKDTSPRVITNIRGNFETDKNPASYINDAVRSSVPYNRLDRPQEGDPDFLTDASRIYVSMRTDGDANFNITSDIIPPLFEGELSNIVESPFVVIKSDEVRIVARKETDRGSINGSVRIIKEGTVGEDAASIYLLPDGTVQLTGTKIYMGQADQGAGPGEGSSEPYIKYSELESLLTKVFDNIDQFCQKLLTHTTPGYGAPSVQIVQGATQLQTEIQQRKQEIENLKSSRIFGE
jgi:hypothetical protein